MDGGGAPAVRVHRNGGQLPELLGDYARRPVRFQAQVPITGDPQGRMGHVADGKARRVCAFSNSHSCLDATGATSRATGVGVLPVKHEAPEIDGDVEARLQSAGVWASGGVSVVDCLDGDTAHGLEFSAHRGLA